LQNQLFIVTKEQAMLFRERQNDSTAQPEGNADAGRDGSSLGRIREAGQSLFHAADEAIQRALTGDSLTFLQATQQEGGE
jgi:hypothetical protein